MKATGIHVLQALSGAAALAAGCASIAGANLVVQQFDAMGLGPSFRLAAATGAPGAKVFLGPLSNSDRFDRPRSGGA